MSGSVNSNFVRAWGVTSRSAVLTATTGVAALHVGMERVKQSSARIGCGSRRMGSGARIRSGRRAGCSVLTGQVAAARRATGGQRLQLGLQPRAASPSSPGPRKRGPRRHHARPAGHRRVARSRSRSPICARVARAARHRQSLKTTRPQLCFLLCRELQPARPYSAASPAPPPPPPPRLRARELAAARLASDTAARSLTSPACRGPRS
jgi:hypothetical protein